MNPYTILKNPLTTEKAVRMMEAENKITFLVANDASKRDIKEAAEELLKAKVTKVNTIITGHSIKKAYVQLGKEKLATEVMAQLGFM